jgi:xanthine dehydrogenase small subunit
MNRISFVFDGKIVEIDFVTSGYAPTTSVLKYLRSLSGFKGVKEGCGEGDCGACTVVIADIEGKKLRYRAVDSCLVFLPMLHGKQLITVENLVSSNGELHPVQHAMVEAYASQCGYCTPGFVMSLFALYKSPVKATKEVILDAITGNLCRCTGYTPIIEAAEKICKNKKADQFTKNEAQTIALLKQIDLKTTINILTKTQQYYKPFTLDETLAIRSKHPHALIVSGNTDNGLRVSKKHELLTQIIDISDVKELKFITETLESVSVGAGTTIEELKEATKEMFPALYEMYSVFGSKQIRSLATIGGNLGSASPIGDSLPVLMAYNAVVVVRSLTDSRIINLKDFIKSYHTPDLHKDEIIYMIGIPIPDESRIIRSYKISKRKDMDISTCSAGFMLEKDEKTGKVKDIILAYGGMAAITKRAEKAEKFLIGKSWTLPNIEKASEMVFNEFTPLSDARSGEEFRRIAARNLLLKFYHETAGGK